MDNQKLFIPTVELIKEGGGDYEFQSLEGIIELSSWKDFSRKPGQFALLKRIDDYKRIRLTIGGDEVMENPVIKPGHVSAYEYILQNQERIKVNILNALLSKYPGLQEQYGYDEDDALEIMPDINDVTLFKELIELSSVYILNVDKEGVAYVGFSFLATWDDEHGLGILTHQDRVVEIGGTDTAFLTWIAERDLNPEKLNGEIDANYSLAEENFNQPIEKMTKPWWKFW